MVYYEIKKILSDDYLHYVCISLIRGMHGQRR